jgi:DGQHR domain-containing protein
LNTLDFPALALAQNEQKTIYAFGVDGKRVADFATIARAGRDDDKQFFGYQRPEVRKHVSEIRRYLESDFPMMPNAIVLAMEPGVKFFTTGPAVPGLAQVGTLRVPVVGSTGGPAAWVVDGQQRLAAIRESSVKMFPVFVIAFVAHDEREQREQFLLVNSAKPLPRALIHELLPGVEGNVPSHLAKRQLPAQLLNGLNTDYASPLFGDISTATNPTGRVKDNSLLRFLENSLSDGLLYRLAIDGAGEARTIRMNAVLIAFWNAVKETWKEIWHLGPRKSRLLHGAGVVSLGFLMDAMADRRRDVAPDMAFFVAELRKVKAECRWNEGYWEFGQDHHRRWDEIQNTPKDVALIANHLNRIYLRTWTRG